jgi:integrase
MGGVLKRAHFTKEILMAVKPLRDENDKVVGYEVRWDTYDAAGKRHQHRKTFAKKSDADRFEASQKLEPTQESKLTVKEYLTAWLLHVKQHRKPSTWANYRQCIEDYFLPRFDCRIRLDRCKRIHIQAALDKMIEEDFSRNNIKTVRQVLSAAFNQAVLDETISTNPAKHCKIGGAEAQEIVVLDPQQVEGLLSEARRYDAYIGLFLAANMGLARGEALGLRWKDVDFEGGTLSVKNLRQYIYEEGVIEGTPKTKNRRRTLPMPPYVKQELQDERRRQLAAQMKLGRLYQKSDFVCRQIDGKPYHPHSIGYALEQSLKRAGLPVIRFHWLRHSCASLLLDKGVPLPVVSEILGHANVAITAKVYSHALANSKGVAADKLQEVYGKK